MPSTTTKVVLDTNVLVASAYSRTSASRRIVEGCLRGALQAFVSTALLREQVFILNRAVRRRGVEELLSRLLRSAVRVYPPSTPRVVPDDADDDKLIAVAVAGKVDAVVTNDRHLLTLDPHERIRIVRPQTFLKVFAD